MTAATKDHESSEIVLLLHCRNLPRTYPMGKTGIRLGIQERQETVEDVPAEGEEITFSVPVRIKRNAQTGILDFSSPFVQGKPGNRFLYLCWGERQGQAWEGMRRAKLMLNLLERRMVSAALESGKPIHVSIDMTDAKGGPICATIPEDYIEWQL